MLIRMELSLPRDARYVAVMRNVASGILSDLHAPQDASDDVQIALSEACTNAVRHATGSSDYSVKFSVSDEWCEIEIVDLGPGFELPGVGARTGLDRRDAAGDVDLDEVGLELENGRGLVLMRALVDDFEFRREDGSTKVRLVKRFPGVGLQAPEPDDELRAAGLA